METQARGVPSIGIKHLGGRRARGVKGADSAMSSGSCGTAGSGASPESRTARLGHLGASGRAPPAAAIPPPPARPHSATRINAEPERRPPRRAIRPMTRSAALHMPRRATPRSRDARRAPGAPAAGPRRAPRHRSASHRAADHRHRHRRWHPPGYRAQACARTTPACRCSSGPPRRWAGATSTPPWRDGTTRLLTCPLEFMTRLAATSTEGRPSGTACRGLACTTSGSMGCWHPTPSSGRWRCRWVPSFRRRPPMPQLPPSAR